MNQSVLETTLLILLSVLVVNALVRLIRLPVVFGYLIAGSVIGPYVLGWVINTNAIQHVADFGVVLLMFTIGLNFSFSRIFELKYVVFVLGGLQVIASISVVVLIGHLVNLSLREAFVIGCVVAMSSTALVVKQLSDQKETQSRHGLNSIGILLFQDLAVVPILIIIAGLGSIGSQSVAQTLVLALVKGIFAIIVILGVGRWFLKPFFHMISSTKARELFTLMVLFVALGSAWVSNVFGMTYALGAFLSGIMLAETEFRKQIKKEIRPFRDVLMGLFFVSVGMLANIGLWLEAWTWILLALAAIVLGKMLLIMGLGKISKYSSECSIRCGLILAQGGEFGFAILALAMTNNLLPKTYGQVVLAALVISFALAPIIIRYNEIIANRLLRNLPEI